VFFFSALDVADLPGVVMRAVHYLRSFDHYLPDWHRYYWPRFPWYSQKRYCGWCVVDVTCRRTTQCAGSHSRVRVVSFLLSGWNTTSPENKKYVEENFYCCGFISPDEPGNDRSQCPDPTVTRGCLDSLQDYFSDRIGGVMTAAVIFAVIQLICVGLAIYFFKSIHKKVEDRRDLLAESRRINNFYRRDRRGV
jgi:hypothetical protein